VVGFDDILFAEYTQPALTTVSVPRIEIGRVAFQALWTMMADPLRTGREFRVGTKLITRQTTAVAKGSGSLVQPSREQNAPSSSQRF
jgi:LacI family transcriptional regulator